MDLFLILVYSVIMVAVAVSMDVFAWFLHKYVMHGFGWFLHEDHHRIRRGRFEKNDVFGLFFAVISFVLIMSGIFSGFDLRFFVGVGIMLYGIGYFVVHDVLFHRRIKVSYRPKDGYMKKLLKAHAIHHGKSTAKTGVNFGFLIVTRRTILEF